MHQPPIPPAPGPEPDDQPPFDGPAYEQQPSHEPPSFVPPSPRWDEFAGISLEEPVTLSSVARDVLGMLRQPCVVLPRASQPWKVWARVVGLYLIGMLFAGAAASAGTQITGATNMLDEMSKSAHTLQGRLTLLALAGILAPLWEETAFRLPLAPFHPARLGASLALLGLLLGSNLPPLAHLFKTSPVEAVGLVLSPAVFAAVPALLWPSWREMVSRWWSRHFRWVLALSTLGFGFAHAGNYNFGGSSSGSMLLIPLLVMPQLIAGVLLAYARLKLGFWFGVLLHSSVNTVLMLAVLSAPNAHDKPKPAKPAPALKARPAPGSRRDKPFPASAPAGPGARPSTSA